MGDQQKRKKKMFYKQTSKKGRYEEELRPNLRGFIITFNAHPKPAIGEAYRLLNEYADKRYGPEITEEKNEENNEEEDIEKQLQKEVEGIKNMKNKERRFLSVKQSKVKNLLFVKTSADVDPAVLVTDILTDIQQTQVPKTRYCLRLLPVVKTCYAKLDHIVTAATPLIKEFFHAADEVFTFCIMWKVRCNNMLEKEQVVTRLVEIIYSVDRGHTTDYKSPRYVFNVDIVGNICCMGFLENFFPRKKYNLDSLVPRPNTKNENESPVTNDKKETENQEINNKSEKESEVKSRESVLKGIEEGDKNETDVNNEICSDEKNDREKERDNNATKTEEIIDGSSLKNACDNTESDGTINESGENKQEPSLIDNKEVNVNKNISIDQEKTVKENLLKYKYFLHRCIFKDK